MPSKSGSGNVEISKALIGCIGVVFAAIISGVFLLMSTGVLKIELSSSPTATIAPTPSPIIEITQPKNAGTVGRDAEIKGTVSNLPKNAVVWIFTGQYLEGETRPRYWVQHGGPITPLTDGTWTGSAYFADSDIGKSFEITAVVADPSINSLLQIYVRSVDKGTVIPFLDFPPFKAFLAQQTITITRR